VTNQKVSQIDGVFCAISVIRAVLDHPQVVLYGFVDTIWGQDCLNLMLDAIVVNAFGDIARTSG